MLHADDSRDAFLARVPTLTAVHALTAPDGVARMLAFYADERAHDTDLAGDGDMLLFQWGVYDATFSLDVTRQFLLTKSEEPTQLSLTFHFAPTPALRALGRGDFWCTTPDAAAIVAFRTRIDASAAYQAVVGTKALRVVLGYDRC